VKQDSSTVEANKSAGDSEPVIVEKPKEDHTDSLLDLFSIPNYGASTSATPIAEIQ